MNILIVEDEPRAASRLERMIMAQLPSAKIVAQTASVLKTLEWLRTHPEPDLIFLDVRLEDGESFEVLAQHDVVSPIIFCTAYSEYALDAFEANSIDYLLKPVSEEKLARALSKYERYTGFRMKSPEWQFLTEEPVEKSYKKRLMVPAGQQFTMLETEKIVLLEAYLKGTKIIDEMGKEWFLDDPVSKVAESLDPKYFFRINRQHVVRLAACSAIKRLGSNHVVSISGVAEPRTVSRARVKEFKQVLAEGSC